MGTVAVFGAAGFVGATLVERLLAGGRHEVRPYIHSTGNAWRLSRHGLELRPVDVRDRALVREALVGVSHVVNCTLGPRDVMYGGLRNLLRESLSARVDRFVHLSSVSAYGSREPGSELHESAAPNRRLSGYGRMKRDQDRLVARAGRRGLASVLLAPPMISGAYSPFLVRLLAALRRDALALVDDGALPCSLIDVCNLAQAIECALDAERADASRYIVTDESPVTWRELVAALAPLAERDGPPPGTDLATARRIGDPAEPRTSPLATLRTLASALGSPQARALLRRDPLARRIHRLAGRALPASLVSPLSESPARSAAAPAALDAYSLGVQTRAVRHLGDGARTVLGYRPGLDFQGSMAAFRRWYEQTHGYGTDAWPLTRQL